MLCSLLFWGFTLACASAILFTAYSLFFKQYWRYKWYLKTYGKRCAGIFYPVIGNIKLSRDSFKSSGDSLKWVKDRVQHNPEVQFMIGYSSVHVVDADLVKDVTLNHLDSIQKAGSLEFKELLFMEGIIFAEGEKWKKQRAILSHSFSYDILKNRIPKFNSIVSKMIHQINTFEGKQPVRISQECQKITAEVVVRSFFGDRFSEQKHEGENLGLCLTNLLLDTFAQTRRLNVILPKLFLPKFSHKWFYDKPHKAVRERILRFRQLIVDEVDLRISNYNKDKSNKDFLDLLIDEHLVNLQANSGIKNDTYITKESIVHQFIVFFFAGMDTTGNLVGIMIYWLAKRTDILESVQREIERVFGKEEEGKDIEINDSNLKQLTYCHMFINEALRYHSPALSLFQRRVLKDFKIGGDILVKKGMDINVSLHGILRREKYFENADEFNPERFSDDNKRKLNHLAFIPFSSGPKNCIGQHMAMIEAKIILIHFVRNFNIKLNEDVPLKMKFNSLYIPDDDRLVFLERKEQPKSTIQTKQQK